MTGRENLDSLSWKYNPRDAGAVFLDRYSSFNMMDGRTAGAVLISRIIVFVEVTALGAELGNGRVKMVMSNLIFIN